MNDTFLYEPFSSFLFRVPFYPLKFLLSSDYSDYLFNEAIFLASPEFYREKQKNLADKKKMGIKMSTTLYKYYSRSCTRCTPFGLFAGCAMGRIEKETSIILCGKEDYCRYTRLDMNYLCALIQYIERVPYIKEQLRFFPNDSIYLLGDKLRYVEYSYRGTKRTHSIQSVDFSIHLELVLSEASSGKRISELTELLVKKDVDKEEAVGFICELIDSQILKSELQPPVTGEDVLQNIIKKIEILEGLTGVLNILNSIRKELHNIDLNINKNTPIDYQKIISSINKFPIKYDEKYLFQTDLFKHTVSSSISENIIKDVGHAIQFLQRISLLCNTEESRLDKFKRAFAERYEEEEVPLLQVMDTESGIGYPIGKVREEINPLLDNLSIPQINNDKIKKLSYIECVLLRKYIQMIEKGQIIIELTDDDIPFVNIDYNKFPSTLSVRCQITCDDENNVIFIQSAGGATATSLLGRFCHLDNSIKEHVINITNKEQEIEQEKILAEIVHLPESRIGNIAFRPILRSYEIHYLANSCLYGNNAIPASDLTLSLKQNRLILKSIKLDKEIQPYLSNAHNYSFNSLPVYHFLCDMQSQNKITGISLYEANLLDICRKFPRVVYNNIILMRASWIINEKDIFYEHNSDKDNISVSMTNFRNKENIPDKVVVKDGDNELFIDFGNIDALNTFFSLLKSRKVVIISEFLFNEKQSIVIDRNGDTYCNEFIFSYYKKQ